MSWSVPTRTPVKPLSEVEVKSHVTEDDKILILDSSSNEARLADKLEIKWDKWDTWDSWDDFMTLPQYEDLPEEQKMNWVTHFIYDNVQELFKVLLRPYNNLLAYTNADELYCDLQFENWLTPVSTFPIWVTVWNVSENDGWQVSWLLMNARTTDKYIRFLAWDNGEVYIDKWTWVFKAIATAENVTAAVQALRSELSAVAFSGKSSDLDNDAGFSSVPVMTEEEYEEIPWTAWDDKRYFIYDVVN